MAKSERRLSYILKTILFNNRLNSYEAYLRFALKHGYRITSLINYLEDSSLQNEKVLILRHDVDWSASSARHMFELERRLGVEAGYYFRWSTFERELAREMVESGFEVGLHYETLGRYCRDKGVERVTPEIIESCRELLREEIRRFNRELGSEIRTAACHGMQKNRELMVSNNILLEGEDCTDFGLRAGAYDRTLYEEKNPVHIMDNNLLYNYGFSYSSELLEEIERGSRLIILLTHPIHWKMDLLRRVKMLAKLVLGKMVKSSTRKFIRIETRGLEE